MNKKTFNITGLCIPEKHYMVDTTAKIDAIMVMIEEGCYFVINRPRQDGKTTTLLLIERHPGTKAGHGGDPEPDLSGTDCQLSDHQSQMTAHLCF